jgi:hypothetical protein
VFPTPCDLSPCSPKVSLPSVTPEARGSGPLRSASSRGRDRWIARAVPASVFSAPRGSRALPRPAKRGEGRGEGSGKP